MVVGHSLWGFACLSERGTRVLVLLPDPHIRAVSLLTPTHLEQDQVDVVGYVVAVQACSHHHGRRGRLAVIGVGVIGVWPCHLHGPAAFSGMLSDENNNTDLQCYN